VTIPIFAYLAVKPPAPTAAPLDVGFRRFLEVLDGNTHILHTWR
jgi:hypothetical protein